LGGVDLGRLSIPSEAECVAAYCRIRGIEAISSQDWAYYLAFCMFRLASILQGVLSRALQGNASSANALAAGRRARPLAQMGWQLVQESYPGS
jgi:aminoglycoside phosphotransferase (APT) family kinase protein